MPPYPSTHQIEEINATRQNPGIFNARLADDVDVTVVGVDFLVAGRHGSPQAFHDNIWGRLTAVLKLETLKIEVRRVIGGGESAWAAVESSATATSKTGEFEIVSPGLKGGEKKWEFWFFFGVNSCAHAVGVRPAFRGAVAQQLCGPGAL